MKLKLSHIEKYYGDFKALDDVSAEMSEGVYGLLGPNGAGKTTLISIITGILRASRGTVELDGQDVLKMGPDYLDCIGYLPQYPVFYKNFTVAEFLEYMCTLKAVHKNQISSRIDEVLTLVNLADARKKKIGALSGGMRQRVGIAQAILNEPQILVLDEPTAGLDPGERIRFRNIISKLAENRIILLATHIVPDIEYIAREILIMKDGALIGQGTTEQLSEERAGTVWEVSCNGAEIDHWMDHYLISNMKSEEHMYQLRVISDEKPCSSARSVSPSLDDVFLSIFGKRE